MVDIDIEIGVGRGSPVAVRERIALCDILRVLVVGPCLHGH